jgi:NAD(P)-dependent dehydrogenase (short-subunit alcohol dehydrogenase family)
MLHGLGRALAEAVIAAGRNAVVTAHDVGKVADLAVDNTDRVLALPLDVTDTRSQTRSLRPNRSPAASTC